MRPPAGDGVYLAPNVSLDEAERAVILDSLERHGGNKTQTARTLGITTKTLHMKLKRYEEESRL